MGVGRERIPDLVSILVVVRYLTGPIVTIAVVADGFCFGPHESVGPSRAAVGPSYVVEAHHIGCHLFPSPHAQHARANVGGFEFQAVPVPLLVTFKEQLCVPRVEEDLDMPCAHDRAGRARRVCLSRGRKRKAAKHQQNCAECNV